MTGSPHPSRANLPAKLNRRARIGVLIWALCSSMAVASPSPRVEVVLLYDHGSHKDRSSIRAAYDSVLEEEGVPHRWLSSGALVNVDAPTLVSLHPAIVMPEKMDRELPPKVLPLLEAYVRCGGTLLIVQDAGVGRAGRFGELLGVRYRIAKGDDYGRSGTLHFLDAKAAAFCGIPAGKLVDNQLSGYFYGPLSYYVAPAQRRAPDLKVLAADPVCGPEWSWRKVGRGKAWWVGIPLGKIKFEGDDLPLRAVLRTVLFRDARIAHLMPTPGGLGGLVVDWHVDSQIELPLLGKFIRDGMVRSDLSFEFDVTAGPDCDRLGDGLGFDAAGRGRGLVQKLMTFGEIGSHGGWAHNWFGQRLAEGKMSKAELEHYIRLNQETLERLTGRKVTAYSAPVGVHPQPMATQILEKLGFCAYYGLGDTGSSPNRTFVKGRRVSDRVWEFPIMPLGRLASLEEMQRAKISHALIGKWMNGLVNYVVAERTIRLWYSHPNDVMRNSDQDALSPFLDKLSLAVRDKRLLVRPMPYFAHFLQRMVATRLTVAQNATACTLTLDNPAGLRHLCVAIPERTVSARDRAPAHTTVTRSQGYRYVTISNNPTHVSWTLPR